MLALIAASVSLRPCEPCLVDYIGHVFLLFLTPLLSTILSTLLLGGFPEFQGEGSNGVVQFGLSYQTLLLCICSHQLPEEASLMMIGRGTDL